MAAIMTAVSHAWLTPWSKSGKWPSPVSAWRPVSDMCVTATSRAALGTRPMPRCGRSLALAPLVAR